MAEHGVEVGLRQCFAIRLALQPVDHQRRVQGERIESAVQRVGNAAGLEQLGRARPLGGAHIEGGGKFLSGRAAAAKHDCSCGSSFVASDD